MISPNEFVVLRNLAKTFERYGQYDKAVEYYKKAIDQASDNVNLYENIYDISHIYFDLELVDYINKTYTNKLFKKDENPSFYHLYHFLESKEFDFELYKAQLNCVSKAISHYYSLSCADISKFYSGESQSLITIFEFKTENTDIISKINSDYEIELFKYAQTQHDGGFEFFEKLNQSVINFDVAN